MSELRYVIDICGLEEEIRCTICENPIHTDRWCDGNCKYNEKAFKRITDLLDKRIELLPIAPEPHWIPCSAELPKTNDPVNVTYVNHNPGNYYAEIKDKPYTATAHFHKGQWYWYSCTTQDLLDEYGTWIPDLIDKDVEITAWKPLPEPFKGVTE